MNKAIKKAQDVYTKYGDDLDKVLAKEDIEVLELPLAGRFKEIYFGDYIILKNTLSPEEKRELTAHALAHHYLHAGSHYAAAKKIYTFSNYHERQANVFAAYLLIPDEKLEKVLYPDIPIKEIAEKFDVRPKFAGFRLELHNVRKEMVRST
jgi:Zn-dependent peptidase ImmA (M78 family)